MPRTSYDPNYDPEFLYANTKLFALLYDEIYLWYPLQPVAERFIANNELLELIETRIVIPVGDSRWWNKQKRVQWPGFLGKWYPLDEYISSNGLYLPFQVLVGNESRFRRKMARLGLYYGTDHELRALIQGKSLIPYPTENLLRKRDVPSWFASCFHSHQEVSRAIRSYEIVARNHQEVWGHLFRKMAINQLQKLPLPQDKVGELLSKPGTIRAIERFLDDQSVVLPKDLTVREIHRFREEGAAKQFRHFLSVVFERIQGRQNIDWDQYLLKEFVSLGRSYAKRRRAISLTLSTLVAGPLVLIATAINPYLGTALSFAIGQNWDALTEGVEVILERFIGKRIHFSSWVLHLPKIGE